MSWNTAQFFASLYARLPKAAPRQSGISQPTRVFSASPGAGITAFGARNFNQGDLSWDGYDSILGFQDALQLYLSQTDPTGAGLPGLGNDNEHYTPYVQANAHDRWFTTIEVLANPAAAADLKLTWLEPTSSSLFQLSTTSVAQGANTTETAQAILDALEAIPWATNADLRVVNGEGSWFTAWLDNTTTGNWTVVVTANWHHQDFAKLETDWGAGDVLTEMVIPVKARGVLQADKIRDSLHHYTTIIDNGDGPTTTEVIEGEPVTFSVSRRDVDLQESVFRPSSATAVRTIGRHGNAEVIAPGVMRECVIKILHSDFSSAAGALSRTITLPFPLTDWRGLPYYDDPSLEGPVIIRDVFVEQYLPFQVDTAGAQGGTYPKVHMDIGMAIPELEFGTHGTPLTRNRVTGGCYLLDVDVHYGGADAGGPGFAAGGGLQPTNADHFPSQVMHGTVSQEADVGVAEYLVWAETAYYNTGQATLLPLVDYPVDMCIQGFSLEWLHTTVNQVIDATDYLTFAFLVCPPASAPILANFVLLSTLADLSTAPYNLSHNGAYQLPAATYTSGKPFQEPLGFTLPAGWKLLVSCTKAGAAVMLGWKMNLFAFPADRHGGRGHLLQASAQSANPSPFGAGAAHPLTATLTLPGKTNLEPSNEPAETPYDLDDLDQGELYLHIHFWQPRRALGLQTYPWLS